MQSKSLAFIFVVLMALPVIIISTSHELFYAIFSLAILISSVGYIMRGSSNNSPEDDLMDEELEEELEELINIDIEKFSIGVSVVFNMLAILYLFYCAFLVNTLLVKAIAAGAVLLQVYIIIKKTSKKSPWRVRSRYTIPGIVSSLLNIAVVVLSFIHKLHVRG